MTDKLCCVLNRFVECRACEGIWCRECWGYDHERKDHKTLAGHRYYYQGSFRRECLVSGKTVGYSGREPIIFRVVEVSSSESISRLIKETK